MGVGGRETEAERSRSGGAIVILLWSSAFSVLWGTNSLIKTIIKHCLLCTLFFCVVRRMPQVAHHPSTSGQMFSCKIKWLAMENETESKDMHFKPFFLPIPCVATIVVGASFTC